MSLTPDSDTFWDRVEHDLRIAQPTRYFLHAAMIRGGLAVVVFTALYLLLGIVLQPARGYFLTPVELKIGPIYWAICGVLFILGGAFLRFRAMAPIIEKLKKNS